MLDIRTRIRTDLNLSKRIRFQIRSENIHTVFIPSPAWQIANHEFANWLAVPSAFLRFIFSLQCARAGIFLMCCRALASLWARSLCRSSTRKGAAIARFRLFHMESRAGCHGEAVASCATVLWRESCLSSTSVYNPTFPPCASCGN